MRTIAPRVLAVLLLTSCQRGTTAVAPDGGVDAAAAIDAAAADGPSDALDSSERDVADRGSSTFGSIQQLVLLADSLFQFDPTIDPARSATENAAAVAAQAGGELGVADGGTACGSVMLTGSTVTVAFGPAPGCSLTGGVTASGTVTVAVSKTGSTTTLALTFSSLTVNGKSLAGSASFATSTGNTFTVNASLTAAAGAITVTGLTVTGTAGAAQLDGTVTGGGDAGMTTVTFTALLWKKGDCYPSSGSVKLTKGLLSETFTFSATTPSTGVISLTVGRKTTPFQLPAYGRCPPPADGGV